MRKFSWYTIVHPDWQEGQPPLYRLVGPAILPDEHTCDIYFKPNMKGGHRHNHIYNVCNRILFRSKSGRKNCIENNREKARNFSRNYYRSHREERNAASKKWRDEHKEIYNARMRAYRKKQKEQKQAQNH